MAFLDVRKAYPTCRRAAMLERLYAKLAAAPGGSESYRPKFFSAVATMLRTENCRSKVVVDGAESAEYTVGHGLREGAVLSPVLYGYVRDVCWRKVFQPAAQQLERIQSDEYGTYVYV